MSASLPRATRLRALPTIGGVLVSAGLVVTLSATGTASAATPTTINLGTAAAASVIAGSAVTNTGPSILAADLDTAPATASSITGFPPGTILGTEHADDGVAQNAQSDLTTAYNAAASAPSTANETGVDLGGQTLTEGVYTASTAMSLTGPVPLTLTGSASSVFIFQAGTTLTTGSASSVVLTGGVQACNVFWQVGSSATLGTTTSFQGNILALTSISVGTGSTIAGRALARNGAVTLDDDTFTAPSCNTTTPTPPTTTAPVTTAPVTKPPASNAPTLVTVTPATPAAFSPTPAATPTAPTPAAPTPATPTPATPTPAAATPTAATPQAATPTATQAAATTPAAGTATGVGGGGGATLLTGTPGTALASTGINARPILETGGATILVGAGLLLASRRRRTFP
jgi:hypothetical protein